MPRKKPDPIPEPERQDVPIEVRITRLKRGLQELMYNRPRMCEGGFCGNACDECDKFYRQMGNDLQFLLEHVENDRPN